MPWEAVCTPFTCERRRIWRQTRAPLLLPSFKNFSTIEGLWGLAKGALAHLGLARAYAMQGDTAKAKAAYQDFLTLWKDADPDIPIFIAAKAEYAKLQ